MARPAFTRGRDGSAQGRAPLLRGRREERGTLDRLIEAVRDGESRVLVVRGEHGVGKTALLDCMLDQAEGCRVARAAGVQAEMELPYAGLHQLCAPMLDGLERLPAPQRDALQTAFGLSAGGAPDRFLVGLAVLTLLSEVASAQPLVCVVDDVQWLDLASAQALAFVARRLQAESVALVFAARATGAELDGLPELVLTGLRNGDARALLNSVIAASLDERVRDRIVAETRGNPLALLELPHGLAARDLAGGFGLMDARALPARIEESFRRRLDQLPEQSRRLLLVAALEPVGEPSLVRRAAQRIGIDAEAEAPAREAGMVEIGTRVRFRHPLVRSAIRRAATPQQRREAHRALAEATDPGTDPDRRAWHRAQAAAGPDEEVAAEVERSADRAQARGGLAAAAAFLQRSAELTPDAARRAERSLAAAQAQLESGAPEAALALLARAQAGPLDELQRARVDLLRAQVAFTVNRGSDAPPLLLDAARRLEALDVTMARETYLEALSAAMFAGRLSDGSGLLEVARAALAAPGASSPPRAADRLLDGLALMIVDDREAGAPMLRRALRLFDERQLNDAEQLRWLWLACIAAIELWDDERWRTLSARHVELARAAGALAVFPLALTMRAFVHLHAGELTEAAALIEELQEITQATGIHLTPYAALMLAAWRGREAETSELFEASMKEATARSEGIGVTVTHWAGAVLHNGLAHYDDALAEALVAAEHRERLGVGSWALVELVEAAVRCGRSDLAADALGRLQGAVRATDSDWSLGIEARSRALLSEGEPAERLHREAVERLGRTRLRTELARAHLLYGEWLRRERRRLDAREQLRAAHEQFTAMGSEAFAARAARELTATGETARRRTVEGGTQLTAQEAQIARLARDGLSNPEISSRLFISPRTVEYHLHKVFAKLDISSRTQLDGVRFGDADTAQTV